jgi:transcriptional regulator with XRE-family HTH domain
MLEIARNYPTLELVERIADALNIEIYELFVNPLSPPEEMERLYQTVANDIERVVGEAVEKVLSGKFNDKPAPTETSDPSDPKKRGR